MSADVQIDGSIIEINGNTYNAKTINSIHIEPHPNPKALAINRSILWTRIWLALSALVIIGNTALQIFVYHEDFRYKGIQVYLETVALLHGHVIEIVTMLYLPTALMVFCAIKIPGLLKRATGRVMEMRKVEPYAAIHFTLSNRKKVMVYAALKGECNEIYKKLKQTINH